MRTRQLIGFLVLCVVLGACVSPEDNLAELWRAQKTSSAPAR